MQTQKHFSRIAIAAFAAVALSACNSDSSDDFKLSGNNGGSGSSAMEPAFETEQSVLDDSIICSGFENTDKPPVLLVHGTFTAGWEQYDWSYGPVLESLGFDVCTVTYPNRGLGDLQISAEYVVNALRYIHAETGRKVAMIGHSQGATMPRWAIKWWPSARDAVGDFILHAGPNHGTTGGAGSTPFYEVLGGVVGVPMAFYQMATDSNFLNALNADDETPGDIEYTTIYTQFDELVQPAAPVPTAALDWGIDNPKVSNILLQDVCPLLLADHVTIGITDATTFALTLDAILNDGPADIERAGGPDLCVLPALVPGVSLPPTFLLDMAGLLPMEIENGLFDPQLANEEPTLKPYAQSAVQ
ncbi:MAG: alpha/beta fold hydrolase [Salinisphaeraceae bacterium]|nr:alpha/beta fold hydrolase [Salinisphaeraceae bacterium]